AIKLAAQRELYSVEAQLLALLDDPSASPALKDGALRALGNLGGDPARQVLANIAFPSASLEQTRLQTLRTLSAQE
ncbi:MAG: hypothetical protein ACOCVG_02290, partial [Verrucomicrobiota bacterium]